MTDKIFKALVDCGFDNVNEEDPKSLRIFLKIQGLTIVPIEPTEEWVTNYLSNMTDDVHHGGWEYAICMIIKAYTREEQ